MKRVIEKTNKTRVLTRDFILITLAMMFTRTALQMTGSVFPLYVTNELGMSKTLAGILTSTNAFAAILSRPGAGSLVDKGRGKGVFILGLLCFISSFFGYGLFMSFPLLFLARFVYGLGNSTFGTAGNTIATSMIPEIKMREGVGYFGLSASMAQAVGPPLALILVGAIGYRFGFISSSLLPVFSFVMFMLIKKSSIVQTPTEKEIDKVEQTVEEPEKWWHKIIEKTTVVHSLVIFITDISLVSITTFLIIRAYEIGIVNFGLYFTVQAISITLIRMFGAKLTQGKLERPAIIISFIGLSCTLVSIFFSSKLWHFLVIAVVYGVCSSNYNMTMQTMMILGSPPSKRGMANSSFFLSVEVGNALAGPLWGFISDMVGTRNIYLIAAWIPLVSLYIFLKKISPKEKAEAV